MINEVLCISLLRKDGMLLKRCKFPCPFYVTLGNDSIVIYFSEMALDNHILLSVYLR